MVGGLGILLAIAVSIKQLMQRDPPLHREFASQDQINALVKRIDELQGNVEENFHDLREERSRSIGNLHSKMDQIDRRNQEITEALRKETKSDFVGMHQMFQQLLSNFSELRGEIRTEMKSRHPFPVRKL